MDPENRFLERFKNVRFVGKSGNGPPIQLALISIVRPCGDIIDTFGNLPCIWLQERFKTLNVVGRFINHIVGMLSEILALERSRIETNL